MFFFFWDLSWSSLLDCHRHVLVLCCWVMRVARRVYQVSILMGRRWIHLRVSWFWHHILTTTYKEANCGVASRLLVTRLCTAIRRLVLLPGTLILPAGTDNFSSASPLARLMLHSTHIEEHLSRGTARPPYCFFSCFSAYERCTSSNGPASEAVPLRYVRGRVFL